MSVTISDFVLIISLITVTIGLVLTAMQTVIFFGTFTLLDVFIAILVLDLVVAFVIKLIFKEDVDDSSEVEESTDETISIATGGYARL